MGDVGQGGDVSRRREQAFRALAQKVTPEVGLYLRRRLYPLPASDLDDLVEEVLIVLWRRFDDVPEDAEVAWSIGVARNVLRNAQRSARRASAHVARPVGPDASAEDQVVADETVRGALAALSHEDRELLTLHAWDGLGTRELAITYGITENAAAVRLSRARARFEAQMAEVATW
ncbi:MAG: RNA polymerase sigma factor [Acidimicrobiales bacterium]